MACDRPDGHEGTMSSRIGAAARIRPALAAPDIEIARPGPAARVPTWMAAAGIISSILIMIGASLLSSSWMGPLAARPPAGPPWALQSAHVPAWTVIVALWLAAILGGGGVAAGLMAARRGARVSIRALGATALIAVAALTVLPPAGSTDALDYSAYGRIVVLGHSPYVLAPYHLRLAHDVFGRSVPMEWDRHVTLYGPLATAEQFAAAWLGGSSPARTVFWLKLWNAIAFGAVALVADRLLRRDPAARLRAHVLWTVNPLLLWGLVAGGHLDVLAAAAGLLGLLAPLGWPLDAGLVRGGRGLNVGLARGGRLDAGLVRGGRAAHPGPLHAAAAGLLVGIAADIKVSYVLFGLGLAWALRRSPAALAAAAGAALAVLVPTYAWFGPPAIKAVLERSSNTTADNFYQFFAAPGGYVLQHLPLVATALVACLACLMLWRLPASVQAPPTVRPALALSVAWLFVWPYQLSWYDAMIICLLVLYPASRLDWLVLARLTASTIALMPGSPWPLPGRLMTALSHDSQVGAAVVLLGGATALVGLCVQGRWNPRQGGGAAVASGQRQQPPADSWR
jgi:hypothetical protein